MLEAPRMSNVLDTGEHDKFVSLLSEQVTRAASWVSEPMLTMCAKSEISQTIGLDEVIAQFHRAYGGSGLEEALVTPEELGLELDGSWESALRECRRYAVYALHVASSGENLRGLTMALQIYNALMIYCFQR